MAKDKPVEKDKPVGGDKPPKRDKATKEKAKRCVEKFWRVDIVSAAMDKHTSVARGLLKLHGVTPDEWKAAGGSNAG